MNSIFLLINHDPKKRVFMINGSQISCCISGKNNEWEFLEFYITGMWNTVLYISMGNKLGLKASYLTSYETL